MARLNRISQQFWPESYNLELTVSEDLLSLGGKLEIIGQRRSKPSNRITLNQSGIKVLSAKLYKLGKSPKDPEEELSIERIVHHQKFQELRIHTKQRLDSAKYRIELGYEAKTQQKGTNGVYISSWHDDSDELHRLLTTQLETHYARSLMPCIDEPEAKAVFKLTLIHSKKEGEWQKLFNTLPESISTEGENEIIKFKPTPKMSTYLLALVIGELDSASSKTESGIAVRVFSTPNKVKHTEFALEFATKALNLLEDYFGVKYPLEKCDLLAVPDFDAGGMENWGLITFREDLLLFDEELSTLADKQSISLTIAHEIAHQWFGNLVTMKWWDELWLNEGFANFMEFFIVDKLQPEWNIFEDYLVLEKSSAIRLDSLPSSKPIVKSISSVHQAVDAFDAIAYEKSGSIVRMIYSMIGDQAFRKGLKDYFEKFQFSSASSKDLVASWQKFTKIDLMAFIEPWLYEPGLPLISVSLGERPDLIKISQARFLSEKVSKLEAAKSIETSLAQKPNLKRLQRTFYQNNLQNQLSKNTQQLWQVPIDFVSGLDGKDSGVSPFILKKENHKVQLPKNKDLPIKLNKNGRGFYVTSYSIEFLAQISKTISSSKLDSLDILNLLCDFISLNRVSQFEPGAGAILELISSSKSSVNSHFWGLAGGFLAYIHHHLKQSDQEDILAEYICQLISPAKERFGFKPQDGESSNLTGARFEVMSLGAMAKDVQIHEYLLDLYDSSSKDLTNVHPEQRLLALYSVAKRGLARDYELLLNLYKESHEDVNLREDLAYALTTFEGEKYAKQNLTILQDPELVRSQNVLSWVSLVLTSSSLSKKVMLDWVLAQSGWQWLIENLSPFDLSSVVRILISSAYTRRDLNRLIKFFEASYNEELQKSISEATDIAKSRINWNKKELPKVIDCLTSVGTAENM